MNQAVDAVDRDNALRTIGHLSYLLHTVVAVSAVLPGTQSGIVLLVVAFIIDLVKRSDAVGSWQESHFSWRIHSVLWAGALYLITLPLWFFLIVPGWMAWTIISIWFLYRVVRGWMSLNQNRAMPA